MGRLLFDFYLIHIWNVMIGEKGVLWIHNENPKMKKLLEKSVDV